MSQTNNPILYILDDDKQYAGLLQKVAEKAYWQVINEQSALNFINSSLPQDIVLVLDLMMPELDGIEVIRHLIKKNINVTLILISGVDQRTLHSAQVLAQAYDINVITSLTKPVSLKKFTEAINSIAQASPTQLKEDVFYLPSSQDITAAILKKELIIYYQPQINFNSKALFGLEALVRWNHPEYGLIAPDRFIATAEKEGIIHLLTREIVSIVAQDSNAINTNFQKDIPLSINISPKDITSLSLPEQLDDLLKTHSIEPENITFEITESAVMDDLTSFLDVLNRLSLKGFSLSIDDFGTGFSSLSLLFQAPFKELKIDQSFVSRMLHDIEAKIIVEICILLAKKMNMKVIAEGIEDVKVWDMLNKLGCDIGQGYFIGKPMPVDELFTWHSNWINRNN